MTRRFADTFFFIAFLSEHDAAHSRALEFSGDSSARIVTTRWVLAELADGFATTAYRSAAANVIDELISHPDAIVVPATALLKEKS